MLQPQAPPDTNERHPQNPYSETVDSPVVCSRSVFLNHSDPSSLPYQQNQQEKKRYLVYPLVGPFVGGGLSLSRLAELLLLLLLGGGGGGGGCGSKQKKPTPKKVSRGMTSLRTTTTPHHTEQKQNTQSMDHETRESFNNGHVDNNNNNAIERDDGCDRRLSRAARQIVQDSVLPVLLQHRQQHTTSASSSEQQQQNPPTTYHPQTLAPLEMWRILNEELVIEESSSSSKCPLVPSQDRYHQDELNSLIALPYSQRYSLRRFAPYWYHCGYCGKVFSSRYYLDLHLQQSHQPNKNHNHQATLTTTTMTSVDGGGVDDDNTICWSKVVCPILGNVCEQKALELEPYYGPGSGTVDGNGQDVQRQHAYTIPPCNDTLMRETVHPQCYQTMQDCFFGSNHTSKLQEVQQTVCDPFRSCASLLLWQQQQQQSNHHHHKGRHTGRHLWDQHQMLVPTTWWGQLGLVALIAFYLVYYCQCLASTTGHYHHRQRNNNSNTSSRQGRRLLQKKDAQKSILWNNLFFKTNKKKKVF